MKKLISIFAIIACITSLAVAEAYVTEKDSQDFRIELGLTGYANSNIFGSGVGLDEQIKFSTFNNKVGFIIGAREDVDFLSDAYNSIIPNWTPFFGVDLWNFDLLCGINFFVIGKEDTNPLSMIQLAYNIDFIKPNMKPLSNSLSMRVGLNWYFNQFHSLVIDSSDPDKSTEEQLGDALGSVFIYLFSIIVPRVEVGVTYRLGHAFVLN